jgi:hypothetical protein
MENRKPGCFGPSTRLFLVGCMFLLAASAFFYRAYAAKPVPIGHFGDLGAAEALLFGMFFAVVGIGILSILLIALVVEILTRKK